MRRSCSLVSAIGALQLVSTFLALHANGAALSCGSTTTVQAGDTCFHLWSSNDLTEQQFATLNPIVYPTCGAKLQAGVSVCLGNQLPTSATCGSTYVVLPGDYCYRIWTNAGLTQDAFLALNPNINCTNLPVNWVVCTSSPGTTTASTIGNSSVPTAVGGTTSSVSIVPGLTASAVLSQFSQVSNTTQLLQNFIKNYGVPPGQSSQVTSALTSQFNSSINLLQSLLTGLGSNTSQYGFTPYLLYNSSQLSNLLGLSLPTSTTGRRSMLQASSASSSANPYTKSRVPQRINFNNLTVNSKVYTYMTAIKNQLQCGDCWAFAVTEGVETINAIAGNGYQTLSPQQVLDCVNSSPSTDSCGGGYPGDALQWAVKNGITTDASYPYTQTKGSCRSAKAVLEIDGYVTLAESSRNIAGNTTALLQAVSNQPVVATMRAEDNFMKYHTGSTVLKQTDCSSNVINHAILIVGFDVGTCSRKLANGDPDVTSSCTGGHWICRNQWGTQWGYGGYFYMDMWGEGQSNFNSKQGTCGLIENTWFPVLSKYSGIYS